PLVVLGVVWVFLKTPVLDQLLTGELMAAARGVEVRRDRVTLLTAASLMTAAALAFTGPIGFVGLIVPHAMRRLVGSTHRVLLPTSLLGGATLLMVCDAAARTVIAPAEIPVGVLTALIGAPFFLAILLRKA
ncbi:MAG: iron chelate uptake ABC transporter family permease subunit, partial [Myxococcota bacterium]